MNAACDDNVRRAIARMAGLPFVPQRESHNVSLMAGKVATSAFTIPFMIFARYALLLA